jgi:serine/threonine-protein kinase
MAAVFAARQVGPKGVGRLVAVKVMSTALASDPASQAAFLREASIATRIEHPNVVRTYEIGDVDGEIFIAMELVHGESLSNLQKENEQPIPLAVGLRIVADVARGLHAAHELTDAEGRTLGLVHQDVTPHNIVVGYDGISKLLDFGVARVAIEGGSRTETVRGKPAYLAPEQLQLGRVDRRTDLFALGIVLHEVLTGRRLFPQDTSVARAILGRASRVPDVREVRPEIPAPIAEVVAKALELAPERRFGSVDEMRRAMTAARVACGIADVDDADVAAWARAQGRPPWTLVELEREISDVGAFVTEHERVADLPTLHGEAATGAGPRPPPGRRRWPWVALGLFALILSALLGFGARGLREEPPAGRATADAAPTSLTATTEGRDASTTELTESAVASSPSSSSSSSSSASASTPGPATSSPRSPARPSRPRPSGTPSSAASAQVAARAGAMAYLTVWSNPWGRVRIDGREVGDSPISRMALKSGSHVVSVTTKAGESQERRITLGSAEEKTERFVF